MASTYADLTRAKIASVAGARRLFLLRCVGDVALVAVETAAPFLLVSQFGSIAGWTAPQVAMLIGLARGGEAIALIFGRGVDPTVFSETVRLGRFDQVLTRPVSPLGWLLTTDVELRFVFRALAGVVVVALAAHAAHVAFNLANVALLCTALIAGAIIVLSILVMGAALTFLTIEGSEIANLFANGGLSLVSFPLDLYGAALRLTFTFVIPVGLAIYVPVVVVLGRQAPAGLGTALLPVLPVALAAFVGGAGLAWRAGLRRYQSTGS